MFICDIHNIFLFHYGQSLVLKKIVTLLYYVLGTTARVGGQTRRDMLEAGTRSAYGRSEAAQC